MSRPIAKFRQFAANCFEFLIMTLAILTIAFVTVHVVFGADAQQKSFSSPEEAVRALIDAGEKNDTKAILEILGPEAKSFIETGDPVSDREARERFNKSYDEANKLVKTGDTKVFLQVGKDEWPLPIPLVKAARVGASTRRRARSPRWGRPRTTSRSSPGSRPRARWSSASRRPTRTT